MNPAHARIAGLALLVTIAGAEIATRPAQPPAFPAVRAAHTPSEARLLDRHGRVLAVRRTDFHARRRDWLPLPDISPALVRAALHAEDRRFRTHSGVDWTAMLGAATSRGARGGSTIPMQLAALLDPTLGRAGARSPRQKLAQMRAARAIVRTWPRDSILEAWLNLLPWRGDLVGLDAAARALAGHPAAALTDAESTVLAALIAAPSAAPQAVAARACRAAPAACPAVTAAAFRMLGPRTPLPDPALAPQLAARLLGTRNLRTTLDAGLQRFVAQVLAERLAALATRNVRDAAAVVADTRTGEILAYVASAGANSRAAQVDGAAAPRQAGSTLKPFLYGLAIERRLLTAASLLDDSPVDLDTASGLYVPRNYDRSFRGPVSVRSALGNSLNVPAVRALLLTGVEPFRERLADSGYAGIAEHGDHYGFSLALGSAEVTLLEQVAAYRGLVRGGRAAPLRLTPGPPLPERQSLTPEAAAIVTHILSDPAARTATFGEGAALSLPFPAAVKTGTSKAMRDNWCIGATSAFTVGVWVGNFEGDAMGAGVSGVSGSAPAWRAIMLRLHATPPEPLAIPPAVQRTPISFSPATEPPRDELFLPGTSLSRVRAAPQSTGRARITGPVNGAVYAIDPDIPPARQRLLLRTASTTPTDFLALNGRRLGPATPALAWAPVPGRHALELRRADNTLLDRAIVTVR